MDQHEATCGARKPGWEHGPAIGRHRIPCVLPAGHDGKHQDALAQAWAWEAEVMAVGAIAIETVCSAARGDGEALRSVLAHVEPRIRHLTEEFGGADPDDFRASLVELVWLALGADEVAA